MDEAPVSTSKRGATHRAADLRRGVRVKLWTEVVCPFPKDTELTIDRSCRCDLLCWVRSGTTQESGVLNAADGSLRRRQSLHHLRPAGCSGRVGPLLAESSHTAGGRDY